MEAVIIFPVQWKFSRKCVKNPLPAVQCHAFSLKRKWEFFSFAHFEEVNFTLNLFTGFKIKLDNNKSVQLAKVGLLKKFQETCCCRKTSTDGRVRFSCILANVKHLVLQKNVRICTYNIVTCVRTDG